jgi:glycosyltransferase involved in cell wall biosynthesis
MQRQRFVTARGQLRRRDGLLTFNDIRTEGMMSKRKLLFLTYYFPPCAASAAHRVLGFTRYLSNHGWEVSVLAPPRIAWEPEDVGLVDRIRLSTKVIRVPFPNTILSRLAGRFYLYETWLLPAWNALQQTTKDLQPDVVMTTSPPGCIHYLGYLVKKRFGLPWVACLRDAWVTNATHLPESRLQKARNLRAEGRTMRLANCILLNTPLNLEGYRQAYPKYAGKMAYLTNGFDPEDFTAGRSLAPAAEIPTLTLLHAGEFYAGRDPRPLLRVLQDLYKSAASDLPRLRLKLAGQSTEGKFDLATELRTLGIESVVEVSGQVSYADALEAMLTADILVVVQMPRLKVAVPAKLYEYLGAGKPILALAEPGGDIDWVLNTAGVTHRVVAPFDEAGLKKALLELTREIIEGRAHAADPDKVHIFTREYIAGLLAKHLDALVRPTPNLAL